MTGFGVWVALSAAWWLFMCVDWNGGLKVARIGPLSEGELVLSIFLSSFLGGMSALFVGFLDWLF